MPRSRTDYIFWHTSASAGNRDTTAAAIRRFHMNSNGWVDIGYHFVVRQDGTVEDGRPIDRVGAHVAGVNAVSIGVCFSGHADEADHTPAQRRAGLALTRRLMADFEIPAENVLGHNEVNELIREGKVPSKYRTSKTCPGTRVDMDGVRAELRSSARLPVDLGHGYAVDEVNVEAYYRHTEQDTSGGYFPIGANGLWHGGVHLYPGESTPIVSMYPGEVVAVRLGDLDTGEGPLGSRNFILVRHTVSDRITVTAMPPAVPTTYRVQAPKLNLRAEPTTDARSLGKLARGDTLERVERVEARQNGYPWVKVSVTASKTPGLAGSIGYVAEVDRFVHLVAPAVAPAQDSSGGREVFYSLYLHLKPLELRTDNPDIAPFTWIPKRVTGLVIKGDGVRLRSSPNGEKIGTLTRGEALAVSSDDAVSSGGYTWYKATRGGAGGGSEGYVAYASSWAHLDETPDPAFLEKVRGGAVVCVQGAPVLGGTPLWLVGRYGDPKPVATLHWEVFSERNLLPGWEVAEDADDNLTVDTNRILELLKFEPLLPEQRPGAADVDAFYRSDAAQEMRTIACRFMSEWAVELNSIPTAGPGLVMTDGLAQAVEPYLWWSEAKAAGVTLPADRRVWHYNPIAFAQVLVSLAGPPVEPHATIEELEREKRYTVKDGVVLDPSVEPEVSDLADAFYSVTGQTLVITSNLRTPQRQASAMYPKFASGEAKRLYRNQNLLGEISTAYEKSVSAKHSRSRTVDAMAEVIQAQVDRKAYISRHLRAGAIDVRKLSTAHTATLRAVMREQGHSLLVEGDHLHIELNLGPRP